MTTHHSEHRARRRAGSARARALVSLGAVAMLATGLSVKGTFAFWTDAATVQTGSFSSGTLDIKVNGDLAGQGGTSNLAGSFALANLVPGESQAVSFPVANNGTVGLTYTATGTASGALAPGMQFSVHPGTSSNTGTAANGNRTGSCSGTALSTNKVLGGTPATLIGTARSLTVSGATSSEQVCVIARLDPNADNTLQGKTMTASLVFDAKQVGA